MHSSNTIWRTEDPTALELPSTATTRDAGTTRVQVNHSGNMMPRMVDHTAPEPLLTATTRDAGTTKKLDNPSTNAKRHTQLAMRTEFHQIFTEHHAREETHTMSMLCPRMADHTAPEPLLIAITRDAGTTKKLDNPSTNVRRPIQLATRTEFHQIFMEHHAKEETHTTSMPLLNSQHAKECSEKLSVPTAPPEILQMVRTSSNTTPLTEDPTAPEPPWTATTRDAGTTKKLDNL